MFKHDLHSLYSNKKNNLLRTLEKSLIYNGEKGIKYYSYLESSFISLSNSRTKRRRQGGPVGQNKVFDKLTG